MGEGEVEVEVEVPEEEATNPIIEVGEDLPIPQTIEETESIRSGMRVKMLSRALASPMNIGCGTTMKIKWGIRREMREIPRGTTQKSTRIERGLEVQAQEGKDPTEMTDHMIEEITAKIGGETPIKIGETIALIEGIIALRGEAEGTIVQDKGLIEGEKGVGEIILLIRVEGTLDKKGEGVARGPMVIEDP